MGDNTVAILGGRGMLGTDLVRTCSAHGFDFEVYDLPQFDITNPQHLQRVVSQAAIIVNCAAYTDVEKAEAEVDLAYQVNATAVGTLGKLAREAGKWVLHISTDFVFDGKLDRPYTETDEPNPINIYGKTKLAGEKLLAESGSQHCIIRLEWTYGHAGQNFVTKLIEHAKGDKNIRVVDDQIGSPTATMEVAEIICGLLRRKPEGLFHFATSGWATRFEVAKFIFDRLGMSINLTACKSNDYFTAAARPLNSCFNCSKIQALLDKPIKMWQIPLRRFLEQL
jgi:dTDP-4-dehydrorhamnose reductase